MWERPLLWYVVAVLGLTVFGGSVATGQFSLLYTPLVLVVGVAALVFGTYLARRAP